MPQDAPDSVGERPVCNISYNICPPDAESASETRIRAVPYVGSVNTKDRSADCAPREHDTVYKTIEPTRVSIDSICDTPTRRSPDTETRLDGPRSLLDA